ncbi:metallophosphoesterase [Paenibacillus arenilitoris]|uniref:Metallophosphoesterase n=1 Tax=Paenibacillus arenilitoris TaxID=2772299 RepID=A0A927CM41_9BACL|nr:metallophosphoesterase [Paenibacillus arenilitoris]MBD2868120.1 metallophosphoesterase [Paenibacillus arenilitoris]
MKPRFIFIFIGILLAYGAIAFYIGWNGWMFLSALLGLEHAGVYAVCFGIVAFSYLIGRAAYGTPLRPAAVALKLIGSYWFAVLEYALLILPIADVVALLLRAAGASESVYIIGVGGIAFLLMAALILRGSWNAWSPVVRTYRVQVPKRAGELDKLTIAMASDLHLGTVVGNRHLGRLVDIVERMKPDLILLPGDILDDDIEPFLRKNMSAVLGKLKAPLGVYAVTGNHEYIGRKVPEFIAAMDAIGIRVLMDEAELVGGSFYVIGRKDKASAGFGGEARKPIRELVAPLDRSLPLILLDHQPSDLAGAAEQGIDLSVSGHTHRGQMMPNHLITRRLFELDWGYLKKGGLHAVVSSGFGTWGPPVRIGSRSEVIRIEVEFG